MTEIAIEITGDRKVGLKFERFPQEAHDALLARITDLTAELAERIIAAEPQRTGALRRATAHVIEDLGARITGRVFIREGHGKAAALEYGAHATTKVRAHQAPLSHVFARHIAPMMVTVSAHDRRVNIAEHAFLRGTLAAMAEEILASLGEALAEAAAS